MNEPQLALGTVQFGLGYGIAGRKSPVPEREVRTILARAWEIGIRRLDTAPAYGNIEERLAELLDGRDFSIVSKMAAVPDGADPATFIQGSIATSHKRLGDRLSGMLFHSADTLLNADSASVWRVAEDSGVKLGVSCYDATTLVRLAELYPLTMAQLPGNALDQAIGTVKLPRPIEITIRSVFLQGLLLLPQTEATYLVPAAADAISSFHAFAGERGLTPLVAALGLARGLSNVDYCVVGVDSIEQMDSIADAWENAPVLEAPLLDVQRADVIDPRRWRLTTNA